MGTIRTEPLSERIEKLRQAVLERGLAPEPTYRCPKCRDVGATFHVDEQGYEIATFCECYYAGVSERAKESNGVGELFRHKTLANFEPRTTRCRHALKQASRFIERFKEDSLILCGQPGSGKTHLAVAVAQALEAQDVRMRFYEYPALVSKIQEMKRENRTHEVSVVKNMPLLVIDDFCKTGVTQWNGRRRLHSGHLDVVYELINTRYTRRLPTILTTELFPEDLLAIEEGIGSRLLTMAGDNVIEFDKADGNYRLFEYDQGAAIR